jgi:transposase
VDTFFGAECAKEFTMSQRRNDRHSAAFREEAIRQARASTEPLTKVARELGVRYSTLRFWLKETDAPSEGSLAESERNELRRLRKEVRELRMERDILKKATAFFAKHSK